MIVLIQASQKRGLISSVNTIEFQNLKNYCSFTSFGDGHAYHEFSQLWGSPDLDVAPTLKQKRFCIEVQVEWH